ncbi:hypothetical protein DFH29DRAFT_884213 [Suillus ampliporus]|nr:hypothetical protein DFH29DRAFT_884213 [Suillus ampliporus]
MPPGNFQHYLPLRGTSLWICIITKKTLEKIQEALNQFHWYLKFFETLDVVPTFSLPCQHSLQHYILLIQLFGAPNGLCSSITEAKHIKVVKEPWRHSSWYKALGQMLVTNQHLDKLAASHAYFTQCKMLDGTCLSTAALKVEQLHTLNLTAPDERVHLIANTQAVNTTVDNNDNNDNKVNDKPTDVKAHVELAKMPHESSSTCLCQTTLTYDLEHKCACIAAALALELSIPHLPNILQCFLFGQLNPNDPHDPSEVPLACCSPI